MRLLVNPEIEDAKVADVRDFFLLELGRRRRYYRFMARVLEEADAFSVEKRAPIATARDKLLPVYTQRSP